MEKRQLGNSNIYVALLTFGGNVFGWTIDEKTSFEILDAFVASGFNFIDTADVYSRWSSGNEGGESEKIIGSWMKSRGNREHIIIGTKVGSDMGNGKKGLKKKYIFQAVEDSLQRLQTDYIDLYQTHFDDGATPIDETLSAYAELVSQGKVRIIGASNLSPERLKLSLEISQKQGYPRYETFQPEYNLLEREGYEKELEKICMENHLSVNNYYSLASGFLTGKYRTEADLGKSPRGGRMDKFFTEKGFKILAALDEISKKYNTTQASVSIAWLLARPSITAPIASATSVRQLDSLIKAVDLKLDESDMNLLNEASEWR